MKLNNRTPFSGRAFEIESGRIVRLRTTDSSLAKRLGITFLVEWNGRPWASFWTKETSTGKPVSPLWLLTDYEPEDLGGFHELLLRNRELALRLASLVGGTALSRQLSLSHFLLCNDGTAASRLSDEQILSIWKSGLDLYTQN